MFSTRLTTLRDRFEFNPKVIYDIGAHEGTWTDEVKPIFPDAVYVQFEADLDKERFLLDNPSYFEVFGNEDGKEVDYYKIKTQYTTGNSIFRENSHHYTNPESYYVEKRIMKRLDTVVEENTIPLPDFIKIDTQGSELLILEGAPLSIACAQIILLEVSLHQYNEGSPLLAEVVEFMSKKGFVLFDMIDLHYINNVLAQVDCLFCKKGSRFLLKKFT